MNEFLQSLRGGVFPTALCSMMRNGVGQEAISALIHEGILFSGPTSNFYPCPEVGFDCPREIIANPDDESSYPFIAVPPENESCCSPKLLKREDLETWSTSKRNFLSFLIKELGLEQTPIEALVFPYAIRFGYLTIGSKRFEVLFVSDTGENTKSNLMIRKMMGKATLAIIPARHPWTDSNIEVSFALDDNIKVLFLEDVLFLENGRLYLSSSFSSKRNNGNCQSDEVNSNIFCKSVDHTGVHDVNLGKYYQILDEKSDYDLFLDLTNRIKRKSYLGGRREGGVFIEEDVQYSGAWAYAELIEKKRPMLSVMLATLSGGFGESPNKRLEKARRALDVKVGTTNWRSTLMLPGVDRQTKRYQFKPPAGLRWIILRPAEVPWAD